MEDGPGVDPLGHHDEGELGSRFELLESGEHGPHLVLQHKLQLSVSHSIPVMGDNYSNGPW